MFPKIQFFKHLVEFCYNIAIKLELLIFTPYVPLKCQKLFLDTKIIAHGEILKLSAYAPYPENVLVTSMQILYMTYWVNIQVRYDKNFFIDFG